MHKIMETFFSNVPKRDVVLDFEIYICYDLEN